MAELLHGYISFGGEPPDYLLAEFKSAFPLTTHRWLESVELHKKLADSRAKTEEAQEIELRAYIGKCKEVPMRDYIANMRKEEVAESMLNMLRFGRMVADDFSDRVKQEFPAFHAKYLAWSSRLADVEAESERLTLFIAEAEQELIEAAPNWVEPEREEQ